MKTRLYNILSHLLFIFASTINGQIRQDSITMGTNYSNDVWYNLNIGKVETSSNLNYHLAFSNMPGQTDMFYTIWINHSMIDVFVNPNQPANDYVDFDSLNYKSWRRLQNTDTSWGKGGFARGVESHPRYTWGMYGINGEINGDSLYLLALKTPGQFGYQSFYKLRITRRKSTNGERDWIFRFAPLNNTWDSTVKLNDNKNSFGNFTYYNFINKKEVNREPDAKNWDILFTRYSALQMPENFHYEVTGVLQNFDIETVKLKSNSISDIENNVILQIEQDVTFLSKRINAIGYDWKEFDRNTFKFKLNDTVVYGVKKKIDASLNEYYLLKFTRFDGASNGKIVFDIKYLGDRNVNIPSNSFIHLLDIYPNPSSTCIEFKIPSALNQITIYDITGKIVLSVLNNTQKIDISTFNQGIYFMTLIDEDGKKFQSKFIKQ